MGHLLDNPIILSMVFFPRGDEPHYTSDGPVRDAVIPVDDKIRLGYRLYLHRPDAPLILFFHGNGEIASDYDDIAGLYHRAGASLLVVDYRGYGWSTGRPLVSTLLPDAEAVLHGLPQVLGAAGAADVPLFVKGRSLGSAPAVHLARHFPQQFRGLMLESGFADAPSVFRRMGIPLPNMLNNSLLLPVANVRKIETVTLPLLLIHGERDELVTLDNARRMYAASPAEHKRLLVIPRAGHNNLMGLGQQDYFDAVAEFIRQHS